MVSLPYLKIVHVGICVLAFILAAVYFCNRKPSGNFLSAATSIICEFHQSFRTERHGFLGNDVYMHI